MKKLLPYLNLFSRFIPTSLVIKITGQHLFIPVYHTLQGHYPLPHIHHLYPPKTISHFEKDLDFLLKHYQPISLQELYEVATGKRSLQKNSFHLTFDDGLREVYEFAFPILKQKGIPATVFLNSDFVDNQDLFFRYKASLLIQKNMELGSDLKDNTSTLSNLLAINFAERKKLDDIADSLGVNFKQFLKTQQPYLSTKQIHILKNNNFTFGAHSVNHPKYSEISFDEKIRQTTESISFVQENFQENLKVFAFPFHDFDVENDFFGKIKTDKIAELTFGSAMFSRRNVGTHLQRFPMEGNMLDAEALFKFKSLYYFARNINV